MRPSIADIRKDYQLQSLAESEVSPDPIQQFDRWWQDALKSEVDEINAMTLATANKQGIPSARIVLLKGFDINGFVFFTNYNSHKGRDLVENPHAALIFFWRELERQVRIEGSVEMISAADSNDYFNSRPEGSKIGAWASPQSEVIPDRTIIEKNVAHYTQQFADNVVPRPLHWGGYTVKPNRIEFWQGRSSRLHDRICYAKINDSKWDITRLAP